MALALNRMTAYLRAMAAAERMSHGDLVTDVSAVADTDQLGTAFARVQANLRTLVAELTKVAHALGRAASDFCAAFNQAADAT